MGSQKVNCAKGTREAGLGHALLSASSSERWLNCPPSVRLSEKYEDKTSDYAREGTDAHTLAEYKLKTSLGIKANDPTDSLSFYSDEMEDCANGYVSYILELVQAAKQRCSDPIILIEQRLDFSKYVEGGFGTGDCVIIADGTLHIVDYKNGLGILVSAEDNPQMKLYALGALELFDGIYDIDTVSMTIYQPRRENISTHTVFKESLYQWAKEVLVPTAKLAYAGEGEFYAGEHCRFCKARFDCRARAEANLELAKHDFKLPPTLEDDEVESILGRIDTLISWAADIKDYALQAALSGKQWSEWKVVEGRSNRRYTNEVAVAKTVSETGFDPYEHKVMGITAMEKALGKTKFTKLLGGLVEKPPGKPTLVSRDDKRPEINTAKQDFKL